jgi:hypothetical protein
MTSFDPARIVPSVRDLHAALATRRRTLTLVPNVAVPADATQLADAVRALAGAIGEVRGLATASADVPVLCVTPCRSAEDCQRARFFGADGVCITLDDYAAVAAAARSMRMMPLALADGVDSAVRAEALGARAVLLTSGVDLAAVASRVGKQVLLVADLSAAGALPGAADPTDEVGLRALRGVVDAAIVPQAFYASTTFATLVDELDA